MKRLKGFLRDYKLFSVAVLAIVVGLVLELTKQHTAAHYLLGTVSIIAIFPLVWDMWQTIRSGGFGIDILAATAIVASVLLGQYWAAIVIVVMLTGGEGLEKYAERRAKSELAALLAHAPQKAVVIRKGKRLEVPVDQIKAGEKIVINAGDIVPVDAVILDGQASFDESSLTGESLPQAKQTGDTILSGAINLDGALTAKASAVAADSQYQQIIKLVRNASASQASFVRLADRYSLPFTFMAFAIASSVWIISGSSLRFLEVIVVATPCPLLLAAPIALMSGMARASRFGIIIKTGSALERLADTETIAFDKTGTLTRGELSVDTVTSFKPHSKEDIIRLAGSLEQGSNHVVAKAIAVQAAKQQIKLIKAKHIQEIAGRGLRAQLKGDEIIIGRLGLLQEHNISLPASFKATTIDKTAVYVAIGGQLAGYITFTDELRPEAIGTIQKIKAMGIRHILMVTGDNTATAKAVAKQLAISDVHAETLPADKLRVLESVKKRPLVFVGDGVNDAPALTAASVGIALGARGSTAASESADVVIMVDDVSRVATALHIAKKTFTIAQQSILVGIGLSLILMGIFATGKFPPLAGAIIQEVVDVVVIFNALRAHLISPLTIGE